MRKIYYPADLSCVNPRCMGTPTIPIKVLMSGRDLVAITRCPQCHRKGRVFLPLFEREQWLPLLKQHIFDCEICGSPNPNSWVTLKVGSALGHNLRKTPVVKILLTCDRCRQRRPKVIDQGVWAFITNEQEEIPFNTIPPHVKTPDTPMNIPRPPYMEAKLFCGFCGSALMAGAPFCGNCGARTD